MIFTANAFFFCAFPREFCFEECLQRQQSALLWGRGGFDQLRHVVPQGGSLGCQETKQSSGCLGEPPPSCLPGRHQEELVCSHTFQTAPGRQNLHLKMDLFFLDWASLEGPQVGRGAVACWGLPLEVPCYLLHPGTPHFPVPLYCVRWQVETTRSRLFAHRIQSGWCQSPKPRDVWFRLMTWCCPLSPSALPPSFLAWIIWRQIPNIYTRIWIIWTWGPEHRFLLHKHFVPKEIVRLKGDATGFCRRLPVQKLCKISSSLKQDYQVLLLQSHGVLELPAPSNPTARLPATRLGFNFVDDLPLLGFQEKFF